MTVWSAERLRKLYFQEKQSVAGIARRFGCSENKVNYWFSKYEIKKRTISDAVYLKYNPNGDPFVVREPETVDEAKLWGLGLGLYWGEGTKASKGAVRLGNTDPALIRTFITFLVQMFGVDRRRLRFGLQIFSDISPHKALAFWMKALKVSRVQFHPSIVITRSRKVGTYRRKSKYGVVTVYFANTKLRNIINDTVARVAQWQSNAMVMRRSRVQSPPLA